MKLLCAVVVSLFVMAPMVEAKPVSIPNETATLDIPDAWTVKPTPVAASATPALTLMATAPDSNSAVEVVVMDNAEGITADSASFIEGVKNGITKTAAAQNAALQMGDSSTVTLGGVPASLLTYTETAAGGKPVSCHTYAVAANGKMYTIVAQTVVGTTDTATPIVNSLAFASPPALPTPHGDAQAEKYGEIVGFFIFLLAAFVTIRWIARLIVRPKKP